MQLNGVQRQINSKRELNALDHDNTTQYSSIGIRLNQVKVTRTPSQQ